MLVAKERFLLTEYFFVSPCGMPAISTTFFPKCVSYGTSVCGCVGVWVCGCVGGVVCCKLRDLQSSIQRNACVFVRTGHAALISTHADCET
jgi:hypothetical protein